jgi:hypothetical protein
MHPAVLVLAAIFALTDVAPGGCSCGARHHPYPNRTPPSDARPAPDDAAAPQPDAGPAPILQPPG